MPRYHGYVGYGVEAQTYPGVWTEGITEREYFGDILKSRVNVQQDNSVNAGIKINTSISIVADPFAYDNFYLIRYVTYMGRKWTVSSIDLERPRIILSIGGLYHE